jgi:hypothetical protein
MARLSLRRLLGRRSPRAGALHVCAACAADFVNATFADADDDLTRRVHLRCGACGFERDTVADHVEAAVYDTAHANRLARIADDAERLALERMGGWVASFTAALERDLIDAADFERSQVLQDRS